MPFKMFPAIHSFKFLRIKKRCGVQLNIYAEFISCHKMSKDTQKACKNWRNIKDSNRKCLKESCDGESSPSACEWRYEQC